MKRLALIYAAMFCGLIATESQAQQDPGPAIIRLPVGPPPATGKIPAKFNNPYVLVRLSVDETGVPRDVLVSRSAGDLMDAKAIEIVTNSRFPQRTQSGAAVKYGLQLAVTMKASERSGGEPLAEIHQVNAPIVIFTVPPEFSEQARRSHIGGNVLVGLEVDERGLPQRVHVVRGVGYGLDEKAIESVRKYRFRPATVENQAITFPMNVEVNFQLD